MLISKVSEDAGCEEGHEGAGGHEADYHTANELFELMSTNLHYDSNDEDSLTARELVLLYKNIDIGTKLMNDATEVVPKKPNQHVETIVYNDDLESDTDASEIYSLDDMQNVFTVNQERIDFLNNKSFDHLLCPKFGEIQLNSFDLPADYDKNFLFQDPYIKNQLTNLSGMMGSSQYSDLFSTSLIDYICCKRLEDNYNFYMDNIIKYVQHTIEQLKRISNGDYLTDRAKEKWREVNSNQQEQEHATKVLATSTSIPLHVECKRAGIVSWDDIVHSEVDLRSLSKILEKKIVVEIPKLICGSYRLYSRQCSDNLIISCQKEQHEVEQNAQESRVDVVLQLQRSQTGQVMSNINSIMILRTSPALPDVRATEIRPLQFKVENDEIRSIKEADSKETKLTVIDRTKNTDIYTTEFERECSNIQEISIQDSEDYLESQNDSSLVESNDYPSSDRNVSCEFASNLQSSESSLVVRDSVDKYFFPSPRDEAPPYIIKSTDELRMSMQRLHKAASVLEESGEELMTYSTPKRRSPVRVRIKSPYENKSFLLEEKKRKRLLEIRERREKKKMALSENCKISKHKYGKGAITPRASSSVTKLSISNKSFYNSIYGQSINVEDKFKAHPSQKTSLNHEISTKEHSEFPVLHQKKNNKKYVNRNYYLDDAETEMMYMQTKVENEKENAENLCSGSNSFVSNEFHDLLKQLIEPTNTNLESSQTYYVDAKANNFDKVTNSREDLIELNTTNITVPTNIEAKITSKKNSTNYECRKTIDKLYDLIKQFEKPKSSEVTEVMPKIDATCEVKGDSIIQDIESNTSVKNITESNHSCCSTEKFNTTKYKINKKQVTIMPKVIISSKLQLPGIELDKKKKEHKSILTSRYKSPPPDNPLKAISQLLHEFDNVQKTRQKPAAESRPPKKPEVLHNDGKNNSRQSSYRRRSRLEQHLKDNEQEKKATKEATPKEKTRIKPMEQARKHQSPVGDRNIEKLSKKKITDIIDEAKEARGEAVRGPSKFSSRLNSLAQPKKSYVMAHREEYQSRYGRNMLAARLQRLAEAPTLASDRRASSPASRHRWRRHGADVTSVASVKLPPPSAPHLGTEERGAKRSLRSCSSSPASAARRSHQTNTQEHTGSKTITTTETCAQSRYRPKPLSPERVALLAGLRPRVPLLPDLDLDSSASCVEAGRQGAPDDGSEDARRPSSGEDEYPAGEDALATAVEGVSSRDIRPLEPLHVQLSGTFPKRLRIDTLTLSPKHSMQKIFLLQSGDASSVLIKAAVSNLKLGTRGAESLRDLQAPVLSNSNIDWTRLPAQLTTVGYIFPQYQELQNDSSSKVKILEMPPAADSETGCLVLNEELQNESSPKAKILEMPPAADSETGHREFSSQCYKGRPARTRVDSAAQADYLDNVTTETEPIYVENFCSQVTNQLLVDKEHTEICNTYRTDRLDTVNEVEYTDDKENDLVPAEEAVVVEDDDDAKKEGEVASESSAPPPPPDCTSSLDMLVGILNEIQKIICQDQMTSAGDDHNRADIETIFDDVAEFKSGTRDLISITSLDNMRQLESSTTIYSYLLSDTNTSENKENKGHGNSNIVTEFVDKSTETLILNNGNVSEQSLNEKAVTDVTKLAGVDKEVSANIACENHVDTNTEVPSSLLPVVCSRSVNVSNCALHSASEPATLSILPIVDYQTLYSNRSFRAPSIRKIIELPQIDVKQECVLIPRDETVLNEKRFIASFKPIHNIGVKNERSLVRSELKKYRVKNIDLDPMLKIKRDVLVTVYSILVLTVFAALSFPELLMFQS